MKFLYGVKKGSKLIVVMGIQFCDCAKSHWCAQIVEYGVGDISVKLLKIKLKVILWKSYVLLNMDREIEQCSG